MGATRNKITRHALTEPGDRRPAGRRPIARLDIMLQKLIGTIIGKFVRLALKFRPHGGHALPGLIVDSLLPNYVTLMLNQLPEGVVLVTGTNGKTTTTKILSEVLRANDKRVITNTTGSNLVRGVASSLIRHASLSGRLAFDMAVLEVDEASVRPLVGKIRPRWVLALNVSRDQLDRFGEVDTVARHIGVAMNAATEGVVVNAEDPLLVKTAKAAGKKTPVYYFGASEKLRDFFPSDYAMAAVNDPKAGSKEVRQPQIDVILSDFKGQAVTYKIGVNIHSANFQLRGQHNFLNAAAALTLLKNLLPQITTQQLVSQLAGVSIAFGRGERYRLKNGVIVELVLVKNPASFRQALVSYGNQAGNLMIAINDNIADGRDVSWLWDVSFQSLAGRTVTVTSGKRAADMALRLSYDEVKVRSIEPNLEKALKTLAAKPGDKVIMATYTAMLYLHRLLNKRAERL